MTPEVDPKHGPTVDVWEGESLCGKSGPVLDDGRRAWLWRKECGGWNCSKCEPERKAKELNRFARLLRGGGWLLEIPRGDELLYARVRQQRRRLAEKARTLGLEEPGARTIRRTDGKWIVSSVQVEGARFLETEPLMDVLRDEALRRGVVRVTNSGSWRRRRKDSNANEKKEAPRSHGMHGAAKWNRARKKTVELSDGSVREDVGRERLLADPDLEAEEFTELVHLGLEIAATSQEDEASNHEAVFERKEAV